MAELKNENNVEQTSTEPANEKVASRKGKLDTRSSVATGKLWEAKPSDKANRSTYRKV